MRIRSESDGARVSPTTPSGRSQGGTGLRGRLSRLLRHQTTNGAVMDPSLTDGQQSAVGEGPPAVTLTFEQLLEENHLCEASLLLIERENHLLGEITEEEKLKDHAEEVHQLDADHKALENIIFQTLRQSLSLGLEELGNKPAVTALKASLTSAVKAIYQEEEQDRWKQKQKKCQSSSNWKKLHDFTLRSLVESRMDNPMMSLSAQGEQSCIQSDINSMGKQLKEDLLLVVKLLKDCYPPEANICQFYARLYHQILCARLKKISDFVLDDKDCTFLLRWVNEYYPGILQKPELACEIDIPALGKLLPEELLKPLEEQYLEKQKAELSKCMNRVLEEERKNWDEGKDPTREDGCYVSPLAYDIIQFINGMVTAAETVVGSLPKAQTLTCPLTDLMQRFKVFQENIIKLNRGNSRAHIKANLGCDEQFRDVLNRKRHLFQEDVRESCLCLLADMKRSAHTYLLSSVHKILKPQYQKLGTKDWLKNNLFANLLSSIEKQAEELQGSAPTCHQELIGQFHQEVTEEYVRRLLRGEVKLKDKQQQQTAFSTVTDNAESLHKLFNKMGSKEDWLKEVMTKIAEVLKLQDIPAIQMQIVSLGFAYPDLSEKHVSALLKLKTNVSQADRRTVKATLSDALKEASGAADARPFFSKIEVK